MERHATSCAQTAQVDVTITARACRRIVLSEKRSLLLAPWLHLPTKGNHMERSLSSSEAPRFIVICGEAHAYCQSAREARALASEMINRTGRPAHLHRLRYIDGHEWIGPPLMVFCPSDVH